VGNLLLVPASKRATRKKYGTRLLLPVCLFVRFFRNKSSYKLNHLIIPFFQVLLDVLKTDHPALYSRTTTLCTLNNNLVSSFKSAVIISRR